MTSHPTTTRWEARHLETAVLGILGRLLETRAPGRTTCPNCRALIAAGHPCPICTELRRRQYETHPQDRLDQTPRRGTLRTEERHPVPTTATTIDRTGYAATRRAEGWEGTSTDTVPSGPSAVRNAEGPRLPTGARSCTRSATDAVRRDSEVTAVPQRTRTPSSRDTGTPMSRREVAP